MEEKKIISYKGFDKDLQCRGEQFVIGEEKSVKGKIKVCENGYHACEEPLAVLGYYPPATSRYCVVEQSGDMVKDDDKIASRTIKVVKEIGIGELVDAQTEWVHKHAKYKKAIKKTNASATGRKGVASATGDHGAAAATGDHGVASATGYQGAASATGDHGVASATGYQGAASATGWKGVASATGICGAAAATGIGGIAVAAGYDGRAMGAIGCAIVCCERGEWDGNAYPLLAVKSAIIDGEVLKPNTWYMLKGGEFVEV